jgi:hypothetical protein
MRKKLEWLKSYRTHIDSNVERPPTGTAVREYQALSEPLKYRKGQIIEVDARGDGYFHDLTTNRVFYVWDESAYRLLDEIP